MNFHIGQKVVYIGTDKSFDPEPGKTVHTIVGMRKSPCLCGHIEIDVGKRLHNISECGDCLCSEETNIFWKWSELFRPLVPETSEEEIENISLKDLEEVMKPILV
jgi:hypothetical protein